MMTNTAKVDDKTKKTKTKLDFDHCLIFGFLFDNIF